MFDRLRRTTIPNTVVFSLTALGKQRAEQYSGSAKDRVLVALDENGASTIREISETSGLRRQQVEVLVRQLIRGGMIHSVKGEEA